MGNKLKCNLELKNLQNIPGKIKIGNVKIYGFGPGKDKLQPFVANFGLNIELSENDFTKGDFTKEFTFAYKGVYFHFKYSKRKTAPIKFPQF